MLCGLYLMPAGQRALNDKVLDIRADIGAALLNEGEFNTPAQGLTVFIRAAEHRRARSAASWCMTTATQTHAGHLSRRERACWRRRRPARA